MEHALKTAMKASTSKVFETMFFLPLETPGPAGEAMVPGTLPPPVRAARLKVNGGLCGAFLMLIPEALLITMTANFLGEEPAKVLPSQMEETLKEALNMIAGNTITSLTPEERFELDIPETLPDAGQGTRGISAGEATTCAHTLDGEPSVVFSFVPAGGSDC